MKVFPSVMALGAFVTALVFSPQAATAQVVEAEPGTELFEQFRPVYHFMAREKWMNDPCAPYYDEATGLYHMFYQSNPNSTIWGNMTWGHAVSKDQVTWKDYPDALLPFQDKWDNLGVFSGFAMDNAIGGKHTVFYTGVSALPISWKKEYLFGEHVMYATTSNGGSTWHKGSKPLIKLPPKGLNVTGWRDPMPFHSKSLDKRFGFDATTGSNYLLVAGGIHDEGPRVFLYHAEDYLNWEYQGYLLSQEKNTSFSEYSASWGYNFETTIYREMTDEDGELHNVMLFAAEGDPNRYPMWATGTFDAAGSDSAGSDSNEGLFTPLMVGVSDRSDWYANSIYTDKHGKDVLIGWITEDTNFAEGQPQGWDGILSVPREVGISIVRDIHDVDDHLVGPGDWIVSDSTNVSLADGSTMPSKTIKTLKVAPLSDLKLLRNPKSLEQIPSVTVKGTSKVLKSTGKSFELIAQVSNFKRGTQVGFEVRHSADGDEVTTILYDDKEKKVIIDRSQSSNAECPVFVDNDVTPVSDSVWGHFYLYDVFEAVAGSDAASDSDSGSFEWVDDSDSDSQADEADSGSLADEDTYKVTRENLNFHVFVDVSTVEVFVNDRFALSARIYPCGETSEGISLTATGAATFEKVQVWTNPKHAWPAKRTVPTKRVSKKTGQVAA
ncbi:Acid beta-fructofuranosidase [Phytophthora ramorum]|uniref:Glycosyl hydrolase family 32 N-terminal domain-containing protein n=1 Tax=Phytophthora ramorum TaxID=164328 RepID=H3GY44_PHYRM|nr:Acid beta-fructofuranosidase [Phytophthora ramorum]